MPLLRTLSPSVHHCLLSQLGIDSRGDIPAAWMLGTLELDTNASPVEHQETSMHCSFPRLDLVGKGLIVTIALALPSVLIAQTTSANRYVPYPHVENIDEGVAWPAGQALPTFATPAAVLDSLEVQALSVDEQVTFSALQGQVNRTQPRLLLLDARADEGRDTWVQTSTIGIQSTRPYGRRNKYELLAKYADEVQGAVLYDPSRSPHYRNLAGTVAGLRRLLPMTSEVYRQLEQQGVELDVAVDLTSMTLDSPLEIYQHLYDTYWQACEKRLLVSAAPQDRGGDHHHTRDIAAACSAAVVWLDPRVRAERDLLRKFFGDMRAGDAIVLGWYATERSGITTASEFGISTLPADHYISGSVFSGGNRWIQIPPVPKKPQLENKVYVAIFISDGDNIQYTQRAMRRIWDAAADSRGSVALNWTIAPGLVDIGPGILNYYYTTATPQDCFVTGPSGMGYLMPSNTLRERGAPVGDYLTDPDRMDGFTRLTETYLQRSGIRVATIWDDAVPELRARYEQHCRNLYGATVHNFRDVPAVTASVENDRVRFDKLVIPYTGTYAHISGSLKEEIDRWDQQTPLFLSYQVNIWGEMKPKKIAQLADQLCEQFPGRVEFVRADHYFNLYNEAHRLPHNLTLSPATTLTSSDEAGDLPSVIDGTAATIWEASEPGSQWLQLDLGDTHQISRYVIRHAGDGGMSPQYNTRAFAVQASLAGDAWQVVDRCQDNSDNVRDVDLGAVNARFLRIDIEDGGADGTARIADIEIYGIANP